MAVAAAPSYNRWTQRAIEELGEPQYGALPWLSQKLTLPVDICTRWLIDQRTAAAAGAFIISTDRSLPVAAWVVLIHVTSAHCDVPFCRVCLSQLGGA